MVTMPVVLQLSLLLAESGFMHQEEFAFFRNYKIFLPFLRTNDIFILQPALPD